MKTLLSNNFEFSSDKIYKMQIRLKEYFKDISKLEYKISKGKLKNKEEVNLQELVVKIYNYNQLAKKSANFKEKNRYYILKESLLLEYGKPIAIHELYSGKYVAVKILNKIFHVPIECYSLAEIEHLKVEDFKGGIKNMKILDKLKN